eukprot:m.23561 g.23561  ORF g.23561 m.23561 type:complete len:178 (+) comp28501_c0_seq1:393-926(+)
MFGFSLPFAAVFIALTVISQSFVIPPMYVAFYSKSVVRYYPWGEKGNKSELNIGDGSKVMTNDYIGYIPGDMSPYNKGNVLFIFNTSMSPSPGYACNLLHFEDDWPTPGIIVATDSGNSYSQFWGKNNVATFAMQQMNRSSGPIGHTDEHGEQYDEYVIKCFDVYKSDSADAGVERH